MPHHFAGKRQHFSKDWLAASGTGQMRAWPQRQRIKVCVLRNPFKVEAMFDQWKRACGPWRQASDIEGQPLSQKLNPILLARPDSIALCGPIGLGFVAYVRRQLSGDKCLDR